MAHCYRYIYVLPNGYVNGYYRVQTQTLKNGLERIRKDCPNQEWVITYVNKEIGGKWVKQYFIAEVTA